MKRRIIVIDEGACTGCGLCVTACHEGAIGLENGKARLLRENYCDGLGDCLPACPAGAIAFEEREAPPTTMRPSWRPNGPLPPCLRSLSAPPAEILCSTGPCSLN